MNCSLVTSSCDPSPLLFQKESLPSLEPEEKKDAEPVKITAPLDSSLGRKILAINKRLQTFNKTTPSLKERFDIEDFSKYELTKRLKPLEARKAQKFWSHKRESVERFANKLKDCNKFIKLISKDVKCEKAPLKALEARFHGLISEEQFATLCLLYEAIDQICLNPVVISVMRPEKGKYAYYVAQSVIKYDGWGFCAHHIHSSKDKEENKRILKKFFSLTHLGYSYLEEAMKYAPASEQFFFTFKIPLGSPISWSPMYASICNALGFLKPVDVSDEEENNRIYAEKQQLFVLPSFSLFQLYMDMIYEENSLTLAPVLGKCSTKTIESYLLQRKRVVNIGLKGAKVGVKADGQYAGRLMYSLHDIYHGMRYSMIKENEQRALAHINKIFAKALLKDPNNQALKRLKWKLVDGELHKSGLTNADAQSFKTLFTRENLDWKPEFIELVIKNMVEEKEKWEKEFKLTRNDLAEPEQKIYEALKKEKN